MAKNLEFLAPSWGRRRSTGLALVLSVAVLACAIATSGRCADAWTSGSPQRPLTKDTRIALPRNADNRPEDALSRRDLSNNAAAVAAALLTGSTSTPALAKERPQVLPPIPPKPSKDKFIYDMQVLSWKYEPYDRMRLYLQAVTQRFVQELEASVFGGKYFIHWTTEPEGEDFFKFDVVDRDNYNQAARSGLILIDSDITDNDEGIEVYVYKNATAKEELAKQILIEDLVVIPQELQDAIRVIQKTPFPPYEGGREKYAGLTVIVE
mmetsp:Transcript_26675/g.50123  ORF Transcript_26675/g.50123 Transcript_26675/m.50123 type:complete len:266 (-) Transcript_26675:29-826(-)